MRRLLKKLKVHRNKSASPDELLGELFQDVQLRHIYPDEITFVDSMPPKKLHETLQLYKQRRGDPGFDLVGFVHKHFKEYIVDPALYITKPSHTLEQHIEALWPVLRREAPKNVGSLIGLPHPYVAAGGRFDTQFYWDSYFIMLGLAAGGHWDMVENMVENSAYLIRKMGFVPNGNRTYYASRSQPPFFAMMVRLLASKKGKAIIARYLPALRAEYYFWMNGRRRVARGKPAKYRRVVRMPGGELLNRYFDNKHTPRPEGYQQDVFMATGIDGRPPSKMYVDLRAAAESGWDFSSRWLGNYKDLKTIQTTNIVPVDLNCLLVLLEQTIADAYEVLRRKRRAAKYRLRAEVRAEAINTYCYNAKRKFYFDFDITKGKQTKVLSAAGLFPLYAGVASKGRAKGVVATLEQELLKAGGLAATTVDSGQQWDAPNGWAPLQWVAIQGLRTYDYNYLADDIKHRWLKMITKAFKQRGKLVEKYNVIKTTQAAKGGEYSLQDGFGWTNGVVLALMHEDALHLNPDEPTQTN